jgi:phosphatidylglycerophosphate synthase
VGTDLRIVSEPPSRAASSIETTYKSREVEGIVDLWFYRPVGFRVAKFFARLNFTPSAVSLIGGVFGIIAGHLYFYHLLALNLAGIFLHVVANIFDNADGQLARLTNQKSRKGRIIDSVVDHVIWVGIYLHLGLRCALSGSFVGVGLLVATAALSHALQGAAADYSRNGYLYFVKGSFSSTLDLSHHLRIEFQRLRWSQEPTRKFFLALYMNFTSQQELLAPGLQRLLLMVHRLFPEEIPPWLRVRYCDLERPMLRWWRLLMTNTRMLLLFFLLLLGQPIWYFWLELSVFNFLLVYLLWQQENASRLLLQSVAAQTELL